MPIVDSESEQADRSFATIPVTFGLRYFGSYGMWSSNHCALLPIVLIVLVFSWLTDETIPSQLPLMPRGSR